MNRTNCPKLCEEILESFRTPHQSEDMLFLIRNCTRTLYRYPTFFNFGKSYTFFCFFFKLKNHMDFVMFLQFVFKKLRELKVFFQNRVAD